MKDDNAAIANRIAGGVHQSLRHDSAHKHVTGTAEYTDDIMEPVGTLHACLGLSTVAHGHIEAMDLSAVEAAPGVCWVMTAADIPGVNDISPNGLHDDPIFATETVEFWGQPLFAVVAQTRELARRAARLAKVRYRKLPHALDIELSLIHI